MKAFQCDFCHKLCEGEAEDLESSARLQAQRETRGVLSGEKRYPGAYVWEPAEVCFSCLRELARQLGREG